MHAPVGRHCRIARLIRYQLSVRLGRSTRDCRQHVAHQLRPARHQRLELILLQHQHPTLVHGGCRRGVALAREQGNLTEEVALGQLANRAHATIGFSCRQLDPARGDDDHRLGWLTLATQHVVLTQVVFAHPVRQVVEIVGGQPREEINRPQQVGYAHPGTHSHAGRQVPLQTPPRTGRLTLPIRVNADDPIGGMRTR